MLATFLMSLAQLSVYQKAGRCAIRCNEYDGGGYDGGGYDGDAENDDT